MPSRMRQFVHEHGVEFALAQQAVNSSREQDVRTQNPFHGWTPPCVTEPYIDAIGTKTRARNKIVPADSCSIATKLNCNPRAKPREHRGYAGQPSRAERRGNRCILRDRSTHDADDPEGCRPSDTRRHEPVE